MRQGKVLENKCVVCREHFFEKTIQVPRPDLGGFAHEACHTKQIYKQTKDGNVFLIKFEVVGAIDKKRQYYLEVETSSANLPFEIVRAINMKVENRIRKQQELENEK